MKYKTRFGESFDLNKLTKEERKIYNEVKRFISKATDSEEISNFINSRNMKFSKCSLLSKILEDMEAKKLIKLGFCRKETDKKIKEYKK